MRLFTAFTFAALLCFNSTLAFSEETKGRLEHYHVEKPKTAADAVLLIKTSQAKIAATLQQKPLSDAQLELVHEITYALEAGVDSLRELGQSAHSNMLDNVDEAVQAMHYASEEHHADKVLEWAPKLDNAIKDLTHAH